MEAEKAGAKEAVPRDPAVVPEASPRDEARERARQATTAVDPRPRDRRRVAARVEAGVRLEEERGRIARAGPRGEKERAPQKGAAVVARVAATSGIAGRITAADFGTNGGNGNPMDQREVKGKEVEKGKTVREEKGREVQRGARVKEGSRTASHTP